MIQKKAKAKRGRPRKNGHGRKQVTIGLRPDLVEELNAYVKDLRHEAPGAGRGDVLSAALALYRPFQSWRRKRP